MSDPNANRGASSASERAAVLVEDQPTAALLMAAMAVAGAAIRAELTTADGALTALAAGALEHLIISDSLVTPPLLDYAGPGTILVLRGVSSQPPTVGCGALPGLGWPASLDAIVGATLGLERAGAGKGRLEIWADGLDIDALVTVVARTRGDLKLSFFGGAQDAGICFCGGKVRAAGLQGRPARLKPELAAEPDIEPLIALWRAEAERAGDGLSGDLGFVCDHGDVFALSPAYTEYTAEVMAWLVGHPIRRIRFEGHDDAALGVDTVAALHRGRVLAGQTRPRAVGARIRPRTGQRKRMVTDPGLGSARLEDTLCGDPAAYYRRLLMAEGNGKAATAPLPGTRLTPSAEVLGDCLVFYRQRHALDESWLGVLTSRAGHQEVVSLRRRRWANPRDLRRDFVRTEGLLRAAVQHRQLVPVLDAARYQDEDVTVTRFVHGLTLAELIERVPAMGRALVPWWVAWMGAQVARGLHALHVQTTSEAGLPPLVHRAVGPEGVLLGFDGSVRIVDFDLLWSAEQGPQALTPFRGGPVIRAPEAVVGAPVGPRSDQVGVGALLYELLAGERCLVPGKLGYREPLRSHRPAVPNGLAWVVERACSEDPSERFDNCDALARALLAEADTEEEVARDALAKVAERAAGRIQRQEVAAIERMTRSARAMWENEFFEERGETAGTAGRA